MKMGWCERIACAASSLVMASASVVCACVVAACIMTVAPIVSPIFELSVKGMLGAGAMAFDLLQKAISREKEHVFVHSDRQEGEELPRVRR